MNIASLESVLKVLKGGDPKPGANEALFKETLLMTLARASDSDSQIQPVEVETVRNLVKAIIGAEVSAAEVRIAAGSEIYEKTPLDKVLARVSGKLTPEQRATIVQALAKVIKSDTDVTQRELEYFNKMAAALRTTFAEAAGLIGPGY